MADVSTERLRDSIRHWQRHPAAWVSDKFGDNIVLTSQQKHAFGELGKLINAKMKLEAGEKMTEEERLYSRKIGISIASGQGTGKTFWTSLVILFMLDVFYDPLVTCTANNATQLRNVLWSQISKSMALAVKVDPKDPNSETVMQYAYQWQSDRIFFKQKKGQSWFAEAVTVNKNASADEQANTLAGRHNRFMAIVVEEAATVPDAAMMPLEGTLTDPVNFIIMITNPVRSRGFFFDSQNKDRDKWVALRWNAEESERVSKEHIEYMEQKYGRESTPYRVRVLGLSPLTDSDTLIPMDWIIDAIEREVVPDEHTPILQGLDVGAGGDNSSSIFRQGGKVYAPFINSSPDTGTLARWAMGLRDKYGAIATFIDNIGVGHGVYQYVRNDLGYTSRVYSADSRGRSTNPERFVNRRAEMYWRLREMFERGEIDLPNDNDLVDELACIKFEDEGKIQIWKKSKLRKELGGDSPDRADSLAMTCYLPESTFRRAKEEKDKYEEEEDKQPSGGWMAA